MLYSRFLASILTKHTARHRAGPPHSVDLKGESTVAQTESSDTANNKEHGFGRKRKKRKIDNEPVQQPDAPSYTFGATTGQPSDTMDFTFDSTSIDDLLGPMKAIENTPWMPAMMLPGCVLFFTSRRSRRGSAHLALLI
jgi:hypothetical protein